MSGVRSTARWQRLCKELIPRATHCAICRRPLDHEAPARTPRSPSLDHVIPISHGGAPYDRTNLQAVHFGCNSRKGNRQQRAVGTALAPEPEFPRSRDCDAVWPFRNADLHAWIEGLCPDPDNCPRCERAAVAARAWAA